MNPPRQPSGRGSAPGPEEIRRAARLLRAGGLVIFPTETVYGLGANALDAEAVARIFQVKGRPATTPLIVHVASVAAARRLVRSWPEAAARLAARYWPGPLTLVLPKRAGLPDVVTAGLPTVGIRVPDHPVALALIRAAGVPIAAPSANLSARLSPTHPRHLPRRLRERVACVLEDGSTPIGLESTVVSLEGARPRILRPGAISRAELELVIGPVEGSPGTPDPDSAPGSGARPYWTATRLVVVSGGRLPEAGHGVYLYLDQPAAAGRLIRMPARASEYAARLYDLLHQLDEEAWDWIAVELPPARPEWMAIRDRLRRAAR